MVVKVQFIPGTNNWLRNNGYDVFKEIEIYSRSLQDVYDNPRWYLDNLHTLSEYRVSWGNYEPAEAKKHSITPCLDLKNAKVYKEFTP